jgi:hypothetical protein
MIGVQEAFWRCRLDNLGQLPSQIHRILHTSVEALSARGVMNVRGVSGQQHPSLAVGRRLPSHIGESGDPSRTVDPVIGAVYGDERFAEIAQGGFVSSAEVLFRYQNPDRALISQPAQRMDADGVVANAPFRLLGDLDFSDQVAGCRIPAGEVNSGCFPD